MNGQFTVISSKKKKKRFYMSGQFSSLKKYCNIKKKKKKVYMSGQFTVSSSKKKKILHEWTIFVS